MTIQKGGMSMVAIFTILFIIALISVFAKLLFFGLKATWGISKLLLTIVFLPVILVGMVAGGLIHVAFPLLIVIAVVSFFMIRTE